VDIETSSLITPVSRVSEAITSRTRLIVISMLYGVTFDLTEINTLAKKHNLPVFEDSAECYSGNKVYSNADATVLSFGPIKTATAFGGGVIIVRNPVVLARMKAIHARYPVQSSSVYLKKILRYSIGIILLNSKSANKIFRRLFVAVNFDYKKNVVKLMRGFPPSTGLEIYRFQPCPGLLSFLYWRLVNLNETELLASMEKMHLATQILTENKVFVPGFKTKRKVFWLYPVVVNDASQAYVSLNKAGIDAYKGISQLNKIDPPVGSSYKFPQETNKMFSNLLYFPLHKDIPEKDIREICLKAAEILNQGPKL
jgi:dTDP-4-amino-4,6-dideoxygalactose transaminase